MGSSKTKQAVAGLALIAGFGVGGTAIALAQTTTTSPPSTTSSDSGTATSVQPHSMGPGRHVDGTLDSINATSGALTPMGTIAAGTNPISARVDPAGKFAYVANLQH